MFDTLVTFLRMMIPPPESRWMLLLIGGAVAVLTYRDLHKAGQLLKQEMSWLNELRAQLNEGPERIVTSNEKDRLLRGIPQSSIVAQVMQTLWDVRLVSNPDMEAISTMLAQCQAARLGLSRIAPNMFLLVGLLGTVFGLASVVGTLDLTRDATPQLAGALVHMKSAFSCTILGILASLVTSFIVRWASAQQSNFLGELEEFALRNISPRIFPTNQETAITSIEQILQQSTAFMHGIANIMTQAAGEFSKTLRTAGKRMEDGVQSLTEVSVQVKETAGAVEKAAEHVGKSAVALQTNNEELRRSYEMLEGQITKVQKDADQRAEDLFRQIGHLTEEVGSRTNEMLNGLDHNGEQLMEASTIMHDSSKEFVDVRTHMLTAIGSGFGEVTQALRDGLAQATANIEQTGTGLKQAQADFVAGVEGGFMEMSTSMQQIFGKHQEFIGNAQFHVDDLAQQIGDFSAGLNTMTFPTAEFQALGASMKAFTEHSGNITFPTSELHTICSAMGGVQETVARIEKTVAALQGTLPGSVAGGTALPTLPGAPDITGLLSTLNRSMQQVAASTAKTEQMLKSIHDAVEVPWGLRVLRRLAWWRHAR